MPFHEVEKRGPVGGRVVVAAGSESDADPIRHTEKTVNLSSGQMGEPGARRICPMVLESFHRQEGAGGH